MRDPGIFISVAIHFPKYDSLLCVILYVLFSIYKSLRSSLAVGE